jgi:hypothetical protein
MHPYPLCAEEGVKASETFHPVVGRGFERSLKFG